MDRRQSIKFLGAGIFAGLAGVRVAFAATAKTKMTVYKSASCSCCKAWVKHVRDAGFDVTATDVPDVDVYKKRYGVPAAAQSCHTAIVGNYVIEGHVPASDINRLLREHPADVRGLAVPGMVTGSPGMEMGSEKDPYDVVMWKRDGKTSVYAKH